MINETIRPFIEGILVGAAALVTSFLILLFISILKYPPGFFGHYETFLIEGILVGIAALVPCFFPLLFIRILKSPVPLIRPIIEGIFWGAAALATGFLILLFISILKYPPGFFWHYETFLIEGILVGIAAVVPCFLLMLFIKSLKASLPLIRPIIEGIFLGAAAFVTGVIILLFIGVLKYPSGFPWHYENFIITGILVGAAALVTSFLILSILKYPHGFYGHHETFLIEGILAGTTPLVAGFLILLYIGALKYPHGFPRYYENFLIIITGILVGIAAVVSFPFFYSYIRGFKYIRSPPVSDLPVVTRVFTDKNRHPDRRDEQSETGKKGEGILFYSGYAPLNNIKGNEVLFFLCCNDECIWGGDTLKAAVRACGAEYGDEIIFFKENRMTKGKEREFWNVKIITKQFYHLR